MPQRDSEYTAVRGARGSDSLQAPVSKKQKPTLLDRRTFVGSVFSQTSYSATRCVCQWECPSPA